MLDGMADAPLTAETLTALIAGGETEQVELKGSGARPVVLAERLCGLQVIYNRASTIIGGQC